ncbi:MAG: AAA family ATPase [Proteobacteria bacterium]|nr:AAA family ATPase [Pseudomonadota bacterium]
MKLRRLQIRRLPGINAPFEIVTAGDQIHVVHGPNAIGKSSICRAVEALFWHDRGPGQQVSLHGEFELDGAAWQVEREGSRIGWRRDGEDMPPPALPPSHLHGCFFLLLRDLIEPSAMGAQDVAIEIRKQMTGGFDLPRVIAELFHGPGPSHGRSERRKFDESSGAVKSAEARQSGLQHRADRLTEASAFLRDAEQAERRLAFVKRAQGLAARKRRLMELKHAIAALPASLENLTGRESDQAEAGQIEIRDFEDRQRSLERDLEAARKEQHGSGLVKPLDPVELTTWRARTEELSRFELELSNSRREHDGYQAELRIAFAAVGGIDMPATTFDLANHGDLFSFLRAVEELRSKTDAIDERLRLLAKLAFSDESRRTLEGYRAATEILRAWLRAPDPEAARQASRFDRVWLIGAIALLAVGAGLAFFVDPRLGLLSGIGGGILLPILIRRRRQSASAARQAAQDQFVNLTVAAPERWEVGSAEARLRELDGLAAELGAAERRARDRDVERRDFQNRRDGLLEAASRLELQRQELCGSLGLEPGRTDVELVDLARALDQLRQARGKERKADDQNAVREIQYNARLSDVGDFLASHGGRRPSDAAMALAGLGQLEKSDARLRAASSDEVKIQDSLADIAGHLTTARGALAEIYGEAELDVGNVHGLAELINNLPYYSKLKQECIEIESQIRSDHAELEAAGEAVLVDLEDSEMDATFESLSNTARTAADKRDEIADIKAQVNLAQSRQEIQNLLAERNEWLAQLNDRRNEALLAKAGRLIVEAVEHEHQKNQMPSVLARAREFFANFTHFGYDITIAGSGGEPRLVAIDTATGERRGLAELSDGTRAQLLLAARMAFAEEVEQSIKLPLFLDEALDQSDPSRYHAIVRGLGRIAQDQDRQIFYFTADPVDVDRIQNALEEENCPAAVVIDLAAVRGRTGSVPGPSSLRVEAEKPVPAPAGCSAEQYGALIGVPYLDPRRGYEAQHLFHLLWDDLDCLQTWLQRHIDNVGRWRLVSNSRSTLDRGAQFKVAAQIGPRADLLNVFCELWKQGRGRPVDRDVLESSGALGERYLNDVASIASELGNDAGKLVAVLRAREDRRLKGFRGKITENLEHYFADNGYIDAQPVLDKDDLRALAMASPAAAQLAADVAAACIHRWWELAARTMEDEANAV